MLFTFTMNQVRKLVKHARTSPNFRFNQTRPAIWLVKLDNLIYLMSNGLPDNGMKVLPKEKCNLDPREEWVEFFYLGDLRGGLLDCHDLVFDIQENTIQIISVKVEEDAFSNCLSGKT